MENIENDMLSNTFLMVAVASLILGFFSFTLPKTYPKKYDSKINSLKNILGLDALKMLKEQQYKVIAIEQLDKSVELGDFKSNPTDKLALVFGNEINGISDDILDFLDAGIEIPQFGTKHSFNVSVSSGIVLWHIVNQIQIS